MPNSILYKRHYRILSLIDQIGIQPYRDTLQYRIFGFQQSIGDLPYGFFPSRQGPFSLRLDSDLTYLLEKGFLKEHDQYGLAINEARLEYHPDDVLAKGEKEFAYWQSIPGDNIRHFIQSNYHGWWLPNDTTNENRNVLLTIGYEKKSVEAFFTELVDNRVKVLADIRANPYSRKFGFTKQILEKGANLTGIRYQNIAELGIPKNLRKDISGEAGKQALLDHYEFTMLPDKKESLDYLADLVKVEGITALMCYEKEPGECHRSRLAKALKKRFDGTLSHKDL